MSPSNTSTNSIPTRRQYRRRLINSGRWRATIPPYTHVLIQRVWRRIKRVGRAVEGHQWRLDALLDRDAHRYRTLMSAFQEFEARQWPEENKENRDPNSHQRVLAELGPFGGDDRADAAPVTPPSYSGSEEDVLETPHLHGVPVNQMGPGFEIYEEPEGEVEARERKEEGILR